MEINELTPIMLADTEIKRFLSTHKCGLCGSHLVEQPAASHQSKVVCPNCGDATRSSVVKTSTREKVDYTQRQAMRELEAPKRKRTPEEIIKELGF
jgi:uncharacterized Zn finger protein (UPF0148 family)